jgi:predicted ribosome quality control (RQC) complex YloA/Tae2 family protein
VHLSYPTFQALSDHLSKTLQQAFLKEVFSFQENDYYFVFSVPNGAFILRCYISNTFQCLSSVEDVKKPLHNVQYYFKQLYNQPIERIYAGSWDRSLLIECMNGATIVFKMYGSRSNVLLVNNNNEIDLLLKYHTIDYQFDLQTVHKDLSFLKTTQSNYYLPTLTREHTARYFERYSFPLSDSTYNQLFAQLNEDWFENIFYQTSVTNNTVDFTIVKAQSDNTFINVLDALNDFQKKYFKHQLLFERKQEQIKKLDKQISVLEKYIAKTSQVLFNLKNAEPLNHQADVIMANLHLWNHSIERTHKLYDFYTDTWKEITIKNNVTPQKYASQLYQKSKNRFKELDKLEAIIQEKQKKLDESLKSKESILLLEDYKQFNRQIKTEVKKQKKEDPFPFNRTQFEGFEIWMGRNAKNNDLLTLQYAHKEDVWLHARDVSGSHVIIKAISGKMIPMHVIEYAARIAAYYSQRKNDRLCPVSYTFKKYIRKIKGAAPGSVRMDREEVVMVEPMNQSEVNW